MDTTTTQLELPARLGRYEIVARIGAGGMGTVYRGYDPTLKRDVAVKLPQFDGPPARQAEQGRRFEREAQAAARVRHPNVCPVFDVGLHEGRPFIVMALVEGESLGDYLHRETRVADIGRAVDWAGQLLDALAAVHALGIVHRDLKPGNILLDAGRPVVTDFGLSRSFLGPDSVTADGVILGTVSYMAPEQAAGESDRIGPRTDLYSLGVVLYQMLTGRLPFEGPSLVVLNRILHD
ncbi:MAG TPA: serine/threonine-protein kinase, partial [Gemmataceae bacterium]|nr:serine/threonine-protein kinase [Gemmataceae bacterium]